MVGLYGWIVLVALFWLVIAYGLLPERVRLLLNAKLDKPFQTKYPAIVRQIQTQPALVIILIVGGLLAGALLGWGSTNLHIL